MSKMYRAAEAEVCARPFKKKVYYFQFIIIYLRYIYTGYHRFKHSLFSAAFLYLAMLVICPSGSRELNEQTQNLLKVAVLVHTCTLPKRTK